MANILAGLARDDEAINAFRRAITLNPGDAWPYHHLALLLERRQAFDQAISLYRQAIQHHRTEADRAVSLDSLGNLYQDLARYAEAIQTFRQAVQANPKFALPWNSLGDIHCLLGEYEQAVEAYRQAIALDPDYAWPYNNLGLVYEQLREYDLAIETYRIVMDRHTNDQDRAVSWNNLGDVYVALRREQEAIAAYEQAITLDPDYMWPYNSLGNLYEQRGQTDYAYALYRQASLRRRWRAPVAA
jgi:tetratricopeptide (TPR) repeat protein